MWKVLTVFLFQEKDEKILETEDLEKPEKPKPISEAEIKDKIVGKLNEIRRKPGWFPLFKSITVTAIAILLILNGQNT